MAWLVDLDGVVWLGDEPIPGAAEAIRSLRAAGTRVVFLTNNSSATISEYLAKLERHGIPTSPDDLITSAQAAAALLEPETTALVCAGPGVDEALAARGLTTVREGSADVVVVGWHRDFDFARLTAAFRAVRAGARFVATNDDATYPTPDGPVPGGGSIVAAVAYATGVAPEVAGKPHEPAAAIVAERVGAVEMLVGDRPETDGLLATRLGVPFALVLTGVTSTADLPVTPEPERVAADLAELVAQYGK